ncbi:MAG TPA: ferredoxin [Streptosporangiaceae bacterium]|jgi:ferredoxin
MRIIVDGKRCCGAGNCAAIAPEVFDQSPDDGVVILLRETPPPAFIPLVAEAADLCPVAAIKLIEP